MDRTSLSDDALLDLVQRQTLRYFWDFAHPASGLARERSDERPGCGANVVTTGGTGFGIMAIIAGVERAWIDRPAAVRHLLKAVRFLAQADHYHGIFPHWLDGRTGETIPFSAEDDGADLVETSFLLMGLLTARQYFDRSDPLEAELRRRIDAPWQGAAFDWHTRDAQDVLTWHWSPRYGFAKHHPIRGWNECLITYVLAPAAILPGHDPATPRGPADRLTNQPPPPKCERSWTLPFRLGVTHR